MDVQRINRYRKELMGLAALWIFYFHVGPELFSESRLTLLRELEWYVHIIGYCGVEIFLFLSGMGLVYAIHKQDTFSFYVRRFLRVYPAFWIWFTVSTLVRDDSMSWAAYIGRITFYSNWVQDLLAYKWYVAAILMFYLWFPLYYSVLQKRKHPVCFTVLLVLLEFCCASMFYDHIRPDLFLFFNRVPIFIAGVLAGHYCVKNAGRGSEQRRMNDKEWSTLLVVLLVVSAGNFCLHQLDVRDWSYNLQNACNGIIAAGMCLVLSGLFERTAGNRLSDGAGTALRCLGSVSLEFYLVHELIALKVKSYDLHLLPFQKINQVLLAVICFAVSFLAAWVLRGIVHMIFEGGTKSLVKYLKKEQLWV